MRSTLAVLAVACLIAACGSTATTSPSLDPGTGTAPAETSPSPGTSPSAAEPSAPASESAPEPVVRDCPAGEIIVGCWAELARETIPRTEPDGDEVITDPVEDKPPEPYVAGTRVFVHEATEARDWLRAQMVGSRDSSGVGLRFDADVFGWFEAGSLRPAETPMCPATADREALGALAQPDRLVCFGDPELTLEGGIWSGGGTGTWGVEPPWFGDSESDRVFILVGSLERGSENIEGAVPFRVPPEVDLPPEGIHVRVTGSLDHPAAGDCVRRLEQDPGAGEPIPEDRLDSVTWCRQRVIIDGWEPIAGAEGRPYDDTIQLHRQPEITHEVGCDTIGIPFDSFTVRIDPQALVHVWAEPDRSEIDRLLIFWEPAFSGGDESDPVVRGPDGEVVARDGDVIEIGDEGDGIGGYRFCPGIDITVYDQRVDA